MLQLRPNCENCGKELPANSDSAMICSFECTFCSECVAGILNNVCPNCGGGFEKRPVRPKEKLLNYPPSSERLITKIDSNKFELLLLKNKDINPKDR